MAATLTIAHHALNLAGGNIGSLTALLLTGSTLNLQSYMGMIMSTGVSVANATLIVTNAVSIKSLA